MKESFTGAIRRILSWRSQLEQDLDDELDFHVQGRLDELIEQGWAEADARREVARRFGRMQGIRENCRSISRRREHRARSSHVFQGMMADVRHSIRALTKRPATTAMMVGTLALGIGVNTAVFSLVYGILLRPPGYPEPERVVRLMEGSDRNPNFQAVAPANFVDWQEQARSFEALAATATATLVVTDGAEPERLLAFRVSPEYLDVLGMGPALGRFITPEDEERRVVVLGDELWRTRFGANPAIVGTTTQLIAVGQLQESWTVIGVMPPSPGEARMWIPNPFANNPRSERAVKRLSVIGRLADGVTVGMAQEEMNRIAQGLAEAYPATNEGWGVRVRTVQDVATSQSRSPLLFAFGAAGFILLIACVNVANLLMARGRLRCGEVAVRLALGGSKARVARLFLVESVLIGLAGAAAGVLLAWGLIPAIVRTVELAPGFGGGLFAGLDDVGLHWPVVLFCLGVGVLTALVFGLLPSVWSVRADPGRYIAGRPGVVGGGRRRLIPRGLVAVELALALVLLTGGGLFINSLIRTSQIYLGFDTADITVLDFILPRRQYADLVPSDSFPQIDYAGEERDHDFPVWRPTGEDYELTARLIRRLEAIPGVESVGSSSYVPGTNNSWGGEFFREGEARERPDEDWLGGLFRPITPGFFRTLGIAPVLGRTITDEDVTTRRRVAVITRSLAAQTWPGESPLGRTLLARDGQLDRLRPFEVVGVVEDVRENGLWSPALEELRQNILYVPYTVGAEAYVDWQISFRMRRTVAVRSSLPPDIVTGRVREAARDLMPQVPFLSLRPYGDLVRDTLGVQLVYARLLIALAILGLVLAASGIFSVTAHSVASRTHEIGVRMAIGAHKRRVVREFVRDGAPAIAVGVVTGVVAALALSRLIESQLYGVEGTDVLTYLTVISLLVGVALLSIFVPARRATQIDPVETLRAE